MSQYLSCVNPLTSGSDWQVTFPYITHILTSKQVYIYIDLTPNFRNQFAWKCITAREENEQWELSG